VTSTRHVPEAEWELRAAPARDRVFRVVDAYEEPFTDAAPVRALLFPQSYQLEPPQLAVLKRAAKSVGDDSILLESMEAATPDEPRWEFSVEGDGPYDVIEFILVNAMFSPSGQWGLVISEEDHAVIGGVGDFMRIIADEFPATAEPTQHFWGPSSSPLNDVPDDTPVEDKVSRLISASQPIPVAAGGAFGDEQAPAFIDYWKNFRDPTRGIGDWLPGLFVHIYGQERARRLLETGGW
jgi:hypothetical protein